ncbi:MAG: HAD family hydrolase [Lachnospiraceae bacterium]|nr:HAD family hydrolase [Lachnospiraceae bacterium]
MKKGIIFDMDGTLWDSAENVAISWEEAVKQELGDLRKITTEDVKSVMGRTMVQISEILFPMLGKKEALALMDICCDAENEYLQKHGGILYPRLENTLQILSEHYPLYIVSNCQCGYIEAFLEYYKFGKYFLDIECFGNTQMCKGDNIALLARRNDLDKAIYVGDIQADYEASVQAGVEFIHASYGFGKIDHEVPYIREFSELPQVVSKVFGDTNFV